MRNDPRQYQMATMRAEIARLTAALAEAEARGYARAVEDAVSMVEGSAYTSSSAGRRLEPVSATFRGMDMHHATIAAAIRALAQKEAGE